MITTKIWKVYVVCLMLAMAVLPAGLNADDTASAKENAAHAARRSLFATSRSGSYKIVPPATAGAVVAS